LNYNKKAEEDDGSCVNPDPEPDDADAGTYQYYESALDPESEFRTNPSAIYGFEQNRVTRDDMYLPLPPTEDAVGEHPAVKWDKMGGPADEFPNPIGIPGAEVTAVTSEEYRMDGG
jgi:hypothetical protein